MVLLGYILVMWAGSGEGANLILPLPLPHCPGAEKQALVSRLSDTFQAPVLPTLRQTNSLPASKQGIQPFCRVFACLKVVITHVKPSQRKDSFNLLYCGPCPRKKIYIYCSPVCFACNLTHYWGKEQVTAGSKCIFQLQDRVTCFIGNCESWSIAVFPMRLL